MKNARLMINGGINSRIMYEKRIELGFMALFYGISVARSRMMAS